MSPKTTTSMKDVLGKISALLAEGRTIRITLPEGGRLHIDRRLPFLCVYRRPPTGNDSGTERMVLGEASYLIASSKTRFEKSLRLFVRTLVQDLSAEFGAFLIVEIFARPQNGAPVKNYGNRSRPGFRILTPEKRSAASTVEALEDALGSIRILKRRASIEIVNTIKRSPNGLSNLISPKEEKKLNCFTIGLEVNPVYRDPDTKETYPLVLRKLRGGVAQALKKCFFEFSRTQTTQQIITYQALGRRAVVKAVWEVDRRLADISSSFDFLLQATPTNIEAAWNRFKRSRFQKVPTFYYRPRPVDPAELKRRLYLIPLNQIEDPTLAALFREKQLELDRQLTMLGDRGSKNFLYGSLQLFGGVRGELEAIACNILETLPSRSRERSGKVKYKAAEFAAAAGREIEYYRERYPRFAARVQVRDDIVGLISSQGNLLVGSAVKIPESRVDALLQHEVGTHILTYHNGLAQPFRQLYCGLAGYDELQEGLAVLAEYLVGGLSTQRLRLLAARVVAVKHLIDGASFIETFRELCDNHHFDRKTAFTVTIRVFRGGGLTKDAVYLRGLAVLLKHLGRGVKLDDLFVGKIAAVHIRIIEELTWRKVLRPVPLRPKYMDDSRTVEKLSLLQNKSVLDLVERRKK